MSSGESSGQPSTPYEEYSNYTVYDENREKIGKVDDLFIDEYDRPEYMGVKMGALGTKSTLIPIEMIQVNDEDDSIKVSADEDKIKDGPAFDEDQEIDLDYEARVREHYGLGESPDASERGHFGDYYSSEGDSDGSGRDQGTEQSSSSTVGGAAAATGSGEDRGRDEDDEGLIRQGRDDGEEDSESEVEAVKIRKRVKVEQPQTDGESSEEVILEEEVVIEEETEDEPGRGGATGR